MSFIFVLCIIVSEEKFCDLAVFGDRDLGGTPRGESFGCDDDEAPVVSVFCMGLSAGFIIDRAGGIKAAEPASLEAVEKTYLASPRRPQ